MNNKKRKNAFLSFKIGKETFAVSVQKVLEVLEKQNVTEVPNLPQYIEGVINFRGKIIPVADTRIKFKMPRRSIDDKYVVIVFDLLFDEKKMVIGAMVDKVNDVIAIDEENILAIPEYGFRYNSEFISGMLKTEASFIMILDIDKVFSVEEINILVNEIELPADPVKKENSVKSKKPDVKSNKTPRKKVIKKIKP